MTRDKSTEAQKGHCLYEIKFVRSRDRRHFFRSRDRSYILFEDKSEFFHFLKLHNIYFKKLRKS